MRSRPAKAVVAAAALSMRMMVFASPIAPPLTVDLRLHLSPRTRPSAQVEDSACRWRERAVTKPSSHSNTTGHGAKVDRSIPNPARTDEESRARRRELARRLMDAVKAGSRAAVGSEPERPAEAIAPSTHVVAGNLDTATNATTT